MNIQIINGIQLPAFDVEMLISGKLIVVPFKQFLNQGQVFWLYPSPHLSSNLSLEEYYKPEYLARAKNALVKYAKYPIDLQVWARCEYHWRINLEQKSLLSKIAESTIWNLSALENIFAQHQVLKLLILRVYYLSKPCIVNRPTEQGSFYWSKTEDITNSAHEHDHPVVSNASFNQRKNSILSGYIYPYQNLEALQFQCEHSSADNVDLQKLNYEIKHFLGWYSQPISRKLDPKLNWIKEIAALGDRSIELEEAKSNYQAGTDFENIARKSLDFLGFKVEDAYKGGAGGLDLFCSLPYPLVCECKAGKGIPSGTVEELIKLGGKHLGAESFLNSAKLIIGPGNPSTDTKKAAKQWKVSIINAMTLQKLVEFNVKYPGALNLFELQKYLEPGQIDHQIDEYLDKVEREIKVRSHIIQVLKNYLELESVQLKFIGVESLYPLYVTSHPPQPMKSPQELHEILIELSSPLTGYLGRERGNDWKCDRFYYLRDLKIPIQ